MPSKLVPVAALKSLVQLLWHIRSTSEVQRHGWRDAVQQRRPEQVVWVDTIPRVRLVGHLLNGVDQNARSRSRIRGCLQGALRRGLAIAAGLRYLLFHHRSEAPSIPIGQRAIRR